MLLCTRTRSTAVSFASAGFLQLLLLLLLLTRSWAFSPSPTAEDYRRRSMPTCRATENPAMISSSNGEEANKKQNKATLKVLLLHGKGSSGQDFASRLNTYYDVLRDEQHGMELELVSIDGPISLGSEANNDNADGFAWWNMPPFVRSYNATEYEGFETSAKLVLDAIQNHGPFDIIYGHSQGAILTTALLALQRIAVHPKRGYILNGVAWPMPFSKEMESLQFSNSSAKPNILLITGLKDKINAPDTQEKVKDSLKKAGAQVSQIVHPAGHNVPMQKDEILLVIAWMVQ